MTAQADNDVGIRRLLQQRLGARPRNPPRVWSARWARSSSPLDTAVSGGFHRTRQELAALLKSAGLPHAGMPFGGVLLAAELDRVLVSGKPRVSASGAVVHTYAAFDSRVERGRELTRPDARRELVPRYFSSRGPATVKDCSLWSGLTLADVREGLAQTEGVFQEWNRDGHDYVAPVDLPAGSPPTAPRVDAAETAALNQAAAAYGRFLGMPVSLRHI